MAENVVKLAAVPRGTNERSFRDSVKAATHLTVQDRAAVRAVLAMAKRLDMLESLREEGLGDRVTFGTYMRALELLGLVPAARRKAESAKPSAEVTSDGVGDDKRARITALRGTGRPAGGSRSA
jgi:hypothetical protein